MSKSVKKARSSNSLGERKFRSVFDNVLEGMVIVDGDLRIFDINPAAAVLLGHSKRWLMRKNLANILGEENARRLRKSWRKLGGKKMVRGEIEWRRGGRLRNLEYDVVPYGQKDRNLMVWRDVTERKIEEKRREHFLRIAAHELLGPLTSAKVFVESLKQYPMVAKGKKGEYLKKISEKIKLLSNLISELMDVTRFREGKLEFIAEEFDFDTLVDRIVHEFRDLGHTHQIVREGSAGIKVKADKKRISQVINNLIRNAVKYSPEASMVVVRTWKTEKGVGLSVQDFGVGMTREDKKRVFDLYYRGNEAVRDGVRGLGVGLFISSEIIKHHGGRMRVVSREGKGSTFSFEIPSVLKKPLRSGRKIFFHERME